MGGLGLNSFHWNDFIPMEWFYSNGMILHWRKFPIRDWIWKFWNRFWNDFIPMEWFHSNGMISFQWNDFIPIEWFHSNGMIAFHWNSFFSLIVDSMWGIVRIINAKMLMPNFDAELLMQNIDAELQCRFLMQIC